MIFRGRQAHNICAGRPLKMFAYQHIICYNILDCGQIDVTETTEKCIIACLNMFFSSFGDACLHGITFKKGESYVQEI